MPATDSTGDPEAQVLAGDRRQRVLAALGELHADQQAALVLVDMEGYPVQEAARILEVPAGTIKSRCARGRARLAVLLADLDTRRARNRERPRCVVLRRYGPGVPAPPRTHRARPTTRGRDARPDTETTSMPTRARR